MPTRRALRSSASWDAVGHAPTPLFSDEEDANPLLELPLAPTGPLRPGLVLAGKYRLAELIDEGGMGAIWRAHNLTLDIDVAVKVMRSQVLSPESTHRMLLEARASARALHPSIVRVFDFGFIDDEQPFLVMELLDGEPLSTLLRREKRVAPERAIALLLPVADALATAHDKAIVHRDLKPSNVFLAKQECTSWRAGSAILPKIVDFGVARLRTGEGRRVTRAGTIFGTPAYMSPEQARGDDDVDHQSDVWSFAVVLYECIEGRCPFDATNYNALLSSIQEDDPIPMGADGGDAELAAIIRRGLAREKVNRWPSMRAFGAALAAWAERRGVAEDVTGAQVHARWLSDVKPATPTAPTAPTGPTGGAGPFDLSNSSESSASSGLPAAVECADAQGVAPLVSDTAAHPPAESLAARASKHRGAPFFLLSIGAAAIFLFVSFGLRERPRPQDTKPPNGQAREALPHATDVLPSETEPPHAAPTAASAVPAPPPHMELAIPMLTAAQSPPVREALPAAARSQPGPGRSNSGALTLPRPAKTTRRDADDMPPMPEDRGF